MNLTTNQPLVRSADAKLAGVCGGLAAWLGIDPTGVRVVWGLLSVFSAFLPGAFLYLLLWIMMPGPGEQVTSSGAWRLSRRHSMIGGVCGGLADWLGWDPTMVRVLYVVTSLCSAVFPGTAVYILLWIVLPREEASDHAHG